MTESLEIWTVYDHPLDAPDMFVARCFEIRSGDAPVATERTLRAHDLDELRTQFADWGLYCVVRSSADDPNIVESWL